MHIKFHDTYFPYTLDSAPQILHGGWEQGYDTRAGGSPRPRCSWTVLSSRCSWKGCQAIVASSEGRETTSLQLWLSSVWLQNVRYLLCQLLGLLGGSHQVLDFLGLRRGRQHLRRRCATHTVKLGSFKKWRQWQTPAS